MLTLPVDSLLPSSSWLGLIGLAGTWGRPISDRLYRFLVRLLDILIGGGELQGWENLPERGPAVFIGNHLDALGPIAAVSSIPLRLYPWIIADMVDETKAAAYLNQDFTERQLHIPPLSVWPFLVYSRASPFLCCAPLAAFLSITIRSACSWLLKPACDTWNKGIVC